MSKNTPIATFDCYRTLIDFDLNRAALPIVEDRLDEVGIDHAGFLDNLRVMRFYAVAQGPYTSYQDLVRKTLENAMKLHGARYEDAFGDQLVEDAKKFPVFPEVPQALRELKEKGVQLAIITNSDRDFIPHHIETIGVDFDYVLTAEDAGWYKPNDGAFEYLFETIDRDRSLVTHVAQGWDYDIIPAKKYGVRRIWVNRYHLTGSDFYQPYFEIPDLTELPAFWNAKA
ncbi:haloacid dehalogenase type II [Leucobacter sp. wl10]|uniref:haloacid dehalogenase type II n=1 Tax=Leucobacter sp. wl10 TaxID=2304677 RepID=UPI000E5A3E7F|nr:haloacid dehalogenase type II [Leucobacter sp. wl10]RGE23690.1 haloacid dehalogenase type II [Leucobacter sp. wl10]